MTAPVQQVPDTPLVALPECGTFAVASTIASSQEEDALYGSGPLTSLNERRPRRYALTHPSRYGAQDKMEKYKTTCLQNSLRADRKLRDRLAELRFPPLEMLQPARRGAHRRSKPVEIHGGDVDSPRQNSLERRNVVLPRSIRSNLCVDARGRRMWCEMPLADLPAQQCVTPCP